MRIARSPLDTLEPVYQHFPLVSTTRTRNDLRDLRIILIDAKSCCRLTEGSILDGVPRQRVDSAHEAQNYEWPVPTQSQREIRTPRLRVALRKNGSGTCARPRNDAIRGASPSRGRSHR
jgi:hypothetical protein